MEIDDANCEHTKAIADEAEAGSEVVPVGLLYLTVWPSYLLLLWHFFDLAKGQAQVALSPQTLEELAFYQQVSVYSSLAFFVVVLHTLIDTIGTFLDVEQMKIKNRLRFHLLFLLIVGIAFVSNVLLAFGYLAKLTSIYGQDLHVVRWAEWSILAGVMTYIADAMHVTPNQGEKGKKSRDFNTMSWALTYLDYNTMGWATLHGVLQTISVYFGVYSAVCVGPFCYWFNMVISFLFFWTVFWRLNIKRISYWNAVEAENLAAETDDELLIILKRTQTRDALRAYILMATVAIMWSLIVVLFFLVTVGVITNWAQFALNATVDICAKMAYAQVILRLRESTSIPHMELLNKIQATQESRAQVTRFLRYMCHEVRVPLNSLSLGLDDILMSIDEDEVDGDAQTIATMQSCVDVMTNVLNDALTLQKADLGLCEVSREPVDLVQLLQTQAKIFRLPASKKGCTLVVDVSPNLPKNVLLDAKHVGTILRNFISNSCKFCFPNTEIRLVASLYQVKVFTPTSPTTPVARDFLKLGVSNWGEGVTPEEQKLLFRPFSQVRAHELQGGGGTGLGLALTRTLAIAHGGKAICESIPNKTTTFYVQLPLDAVDTPRNVPSKSIPQDSPLNVSSESIAEAAPKVGPAPRPKPKPTLPPRPAKLPAGWATALSSTPSKLKALPSTPSPKLTTDISSSPTSAKLATDSFSSPTSSKVMTSSNSPVLGSRSLDSSNHSAASKSFSSLPSDSYDRLSEDAPSPVSTCSDTSYEKKSETETLRLRSSGRVTPTFRSDKKSSFSYSESKPYAESKLDSGERPDTQSVSPSPVPKRLLTSSNPFNFLKGKSVYTLFGKESPKKLVVAAAIQNQNRTVCPLPAASEIDATPIQSLLRPLSLPPDEEVKPALRVDLSLSNSAPLCNRTLRTSRSTPSLLSLGDSRLLDDSHVSSPRSSKRRKNRYIPPPEFHTERVLIVDDVSGNRELTHRLLVRRLGVRAEMADSGPVALEKLEEAFKNNDPFTIVLLDNHMPGMSGLQVAQHLKKDLRFTPLDIAGVTAAAQAKTDFAQVGVENVLQKPISCRQLEELVTMLRVERDKKAGIASTSQT
eukprot:gb/GEZN01000846.1/.p1 GENE.gb/GEZN01000846.1/~~gb/GEZN01000846.1/.p1  ORF type:complete len:1090 (+),score=109.82 gb/GEZN01000846.1/:186-3455(+)